MAETNLGRIGFVPKENWLIGTDYKKNDVVNYQSSVYSALKPNTGQTPPTNGVNTEYWAYFINGDGFALKETTLVGTRSNRPSSGTDREITIAEIDTSNTVRVNAVDWDLTGNVFSMAQTDLVCDPAPTANLETGSLSVIGIQYQYYISATNPDDIYQCILSGTADLTNTTNFRQVNYITRQDLIVSYYNTNNDSSGYASSADVVYGDTLDYLAYLHEASASDMPDEIMNRYGFVKIDNGSYTHPNHPGVYFGYVGIWQRLNQGAQHKFFNERGSAVKGTNEGLTSGPTSTYDAFVSQTSGVIGGSSGRADGTFYDKAYENQILTIPTLSKYAPPSLLSETVNNIVNGNYKGVDGLVFTEYATQTTTGTVNTIEVTDGTKYQTGRAIQVYDVTASTIKGRLTVIGISGNTLTVDSTLSKSANIYMIGGGVSNILYKGSFSPSFIVGYPAAYPQSILDLLSDGKGIYGLVSNLVDDAGNILIPDGIIDTFKLPNKFLSVLNGVRSTDSDTSPSSPTWTAFSPTNVAIGNKVTLTNEPLGNIVIINTTAYTTPARADVPTTVLDIYPQVIGTNSHSWHKGNILQSFIGKVSITNANANDDVEGKSVENSLIGVSGVIYADGITSNVQKTGEFYRVYSSDVIADGTLVQFLAPDYTGSTGSAYTFPAGTYNNFGLAYSPITSTPSHNTIQLTGHPTIDTNNDGRSDAPAVKALFTIEEDQDGRLYNGIYVNEMVWDIVAVGFGDDNTFSQLTDGIVTDLNGNTCITKKMLIHTGFTKGEK